MKLHRFFFYIFLFLIPIQTRILYYPQSAYTDWYFNYHQAFFVYLSDLVLKLCFTTWFFENWPKIKLNRLIISCFTWLILIVVSLLHVKHIYLGLYQALKWLELMALIIYISQSLKLYKEAQSAALILFISGILQAILAFWQFHVQHMLGLRWLGEYIAPLGSPGLATIDTVSGKVIRAYGTFPHPNVLGGFLILALVCGFYIVSRETSWRKYLVLAGVYALSLGLFTSFSRVAWLAAAIVSLAFCLYYLKNSRRVALSIVGVLIVSCATVGIFYGKLVKTRTSDSNPTSISDRYFFNRIGLRLVEQHPVLGVGVGNYIEAQKEQYKLLPWQYQPAHNIYIFIAAELGIVGLMLFLLILYDIFSKVKHAPKNILTFSLTLIGIIFLIMGQFDHYFVTIQQGRLMFATVLGLIAALPNLNDNQESH